MRPRWWLIVLGIQSGLVAGLGLTVRSGAVPLGVPGEWEWARVRGAPGLDGLTLAAAAILAYAAFAAAGFRALGPQRSRRSRTAWLLGLGLAAVLVQVGIHAGAPIGYGLAKWATLGMHGSSGYLTTARMEIGEPRRFWAEYPAWVARQDALHIGTHPPGLLFLWHTLGRWMDRHPGWARALDEHLPSSVAATYRIVLGTLPRADRAAVTAVGAVTLLCCGLTVWPLYALARAGLTPRAAWTAAVLWPLVPAAVLFQPTADTAYPFWSTSALALTAWSTRDRLGPALLAGVILGLGMQLTLAFLPVGLVAAGLIALADGMDWKRRAGLILAVGAGFLALTLVIWAVSAANPFQIWWLNARNHARFYVEYPRTYQAWVLVNPIEAAVGLGLPTGVLAVFGIGRGRGSTVSWITLGTLALLTLSGRNLSEVARLWLPFFPALLVTAGAGLERLGGGAGHLAATAALLAAQTLALQAMIQVVYPV